MTDIKAQIKCMLDKKMSFGSYRASFGALEKKYCYPVSRCGDKTDAQYFMEGKTVIATANINRSGNKAQYELFDNTTGVKYSSNWFNQNKLFGEAKFEKLSIGNVVIIDNGNHYVDNGDTLIINNKKITVGEYLNDNNDV